MNITIRQASESIRALTYFAELKMDGLTSYRLAKMIKVVNNELKAFDDMRMKMLGNYAVPQNTDDGKQTTYVFNSIEDKLTFEKEIEEVLGETIELTTDTIALSTLLSAVAASNEGTDFIEPSMLVNVDWLISDDSMEERDPVGASSAEEIGVTEVNVGSVEDGVLVEATAEDNREAYNH